jgi:hypothetical protein
MTNTRIRFLGIMCIVGATSAFAGLVSSCVMCKGEGRALEAISNAQNATNADGDYPEFSEGFWGINLGATIPFAIMGFIGAVYGGVSMVVPEAIPCVVGIVCFESAVAVICAGLGFSRYSITSLDETSEFYGADIVDFVRMSRNARVASAVFGCIGAISAIAAAPFVSTRKEGELDKECGKAGRWLAYAGTMTRWNIHQEAGGLHSS